MTVCRRFGNDTRGTTAVEYAIIAATLSIAIIVAVNAIGTQVGVMFTNVKNSF